MESKKTSFWIWFLNRGWPSQSKVVKQGTNEGLKQMEWAQMGEGKLRILKHIERGKMDGY